MGKQEIKNNSNKDKQTKTGENIKSKIIQANPVVMSYMMLINYSSLKKCRKSTLYLRL